MSEVFRIGYARVSTASQSLVHQVEILKKAGCHKIYKEKASGKNMDRKQLDLLLEDLRAGDTLVVTSLERLGRTLMGVIPLIEDLVKRGIKIESLSHPFDWDSATGRLMVRILMTLAEFERELMVEKVTKSLKTAAEQGRVGGRRKGVQLYDPTPIVDRYKELRKDGWKHIESCERVAVEHEISPVTVGRYAEKSGAYKPKKKRKKRSK